MNRRDLFRQTILGAAAAALPASAPAREFPPQQDASKELARADWKPVFLDDHQNQTLIVFSDILIPATDTPGAKAALVNRFLDQLLAAETHEVQRNFLDSLAFLDGASFDRYHSAFVHAPVEQQIELVTLLAYPHTYETWDDATEKPDPGHAHFENLKDWIARAYYNSEAGMRELGYDGIPHGEYGGCAT
jgi:gluconate 2-dehydrogenase gamma chain